MNENYKSAMYKIKAVLPDRDKQFLERLNSNIEIFHAPPAYADEAPNNFLLTVQKALADKKLLLLGYRAAYNNELVTGRLVEPVGLCFYSMAWHLIGYCRYRKDYRDFRLDRITSLELKNEHFNPREIRTVKEFFNRNLTELNLEQITLRFPKSHAHLIQTTRYYYGYMGEEVHGDLVELNFISNDLEYFCRWLLMYADVVEVIQNEKLQALFMEHILAIKKRFA